MKALFGFVIFFILVFPILTVAENAMTTKDIQLTGKNIAAMTGFYETCGTKGLIKIDRRASRLGYYSAMKYLVIGGISKEMNHWADKGQDGFMFGDISRSDKLERFNFTSANCKPVKKTMGVRLNLILNMLNI